MEEEVFELAWNLKNNITMDIQTFINNYQEAFSEKAELPIAFWYSDSLIGELKKIPGCLFKSLPSIRSGEIISLNLESVGCGGGKFYTGFAPMNDYIPTFVSLKEKYKITPESVIEYIKEMGVERAPKSYIHFARIDKLDSFDNVEGLLFLATPDILSGLCAWAYYDSNASDTVTAPFASGCGTVITLTVNENRAGGHRTFLGFFDPSVRPYVESNLLSFTIPMSRFREMYETMRQSCLYGTHAWGKIKARIEEEA